MRLFDFITLMDQEIAPEQTKVHLATWNSHESPLDLYLADKFYVWQLEQTKRNFERKYVLSLICMPEANQWLYAGIFTSHGCNRPEGQNNFFYDLWERESCSEFSGRLVVEYERTCRQSYLYGENVMDQMTIAAIRPVRLTIGEFPGFKAIDLTKIELDLIVRQGLESWRTALSNVAGVYLISDIASGKLYVGSATGEGGIWQRWSEYSKTGHGGNVELKALLPKEGLGRADKFRFSILEIADVHASSEDILQRESHWKNILLTRINGLNKN